MSVPGALSVGSIIVSASTTLPQCRRMGLHSVVILVDTICTTTTSPRSVTLPSDSYSANQSTPSSLQYPPLNNTQREKDIYTSLIVKRQTRSISNLKSLEFLLAHKAIVSCLCVRILIDPVKHILQSFLVASSSIVDRSTSLSLHTTQSPLSVQEANRANTATQCKQSTCCGEKEVPRENLSLKLAVSR